MIYELEPFAQPLASVSDPKLVRMRFLGNHPEIVVRRSISVYDDIASLHSDIKKADILLEELSDQYGIETLPRTTVITGVTRGSEVLNANFYTIVPKVQGKSLDSGNFTGEEGVELHPLIDFTLASLTQYLYDKLLTGEDYLTDIFSTRQYMYGNRYGFSKKDLFMVDVDPFTARRSDAFFGEGYMTQSVYPQLRHSTAYFERKLDLGPLENSRQKITNYAHVFEAYAKGKSLGI